MLLAFYFNALPAVSRARHGLHRQHSLAVTQGSILQPLVPDGTIRNAFLCFCIRQRPRLRFETQRFVTEGRTQTMIWKSEIKSGLRVIFLLLQTLIILSGLVSGILILAIYFRSSSFFGIAFKSLFPVLMACAFSAANGCLGYTCLSSHKKMRLFLFILSLASLLNLQIILAIKSNGIVENSRPWISARWGGLSDSQREFIQDKFQCCGLETVSDRSGSGCTHAAECLGKFRKISISLRGLSQGFLLFMFFTETLSLCILSFLKFGK